MGVKDAVAKNFFGGKNVMAAILDYLLYEGKDVVKESQLREVNDAFYSIEQLPNGHFKTDNRYRDKLFEYNDGQDVISVGLELQSRNDRHMVERIMVYDSRRIKQLNDEDRMHSIINIVLSFDRHKRSPPSKLSEMIGKRNSLDGGLSFDYGYTSLNIYDMAEKIDMFPCDELQDVLYLFKMDNEGSQFMKVLTKGKCRGRLSRDAALVCAVFLGFDLNLGNGVESFDMCKALRDMKTDARRQGFRHGRKTGLREGRDEGLRVGRDEGLREGREEGFKDGVKSIVVTLLKRSYPKHEICDITGASIDDIHEIELSMQN